MAALLKLLLITATVFLPGGFLFAVAALLWHRRSQRSDSVLPERSRARIPAGVVGSKFLRACPSSICYRP